jgi:hypothetical protein
VSVPAALACLSIILTGCEMPQAQFAAEQQAAEPTREEFAQVQAQLARAAEQQIQAQAQLDGLAKTLSAREARVSDLETRLQAAEARLAELQDVDPAAYASSLESAKIDLKQLKGDFVGLDYRVSQRFQDVELIHANLGQADEDLRKHVASSMTNLERRCAAEREELSADLARRLDDERSMLISSVRQLERQTAADRARAALAMQSVRDALASEQTAVSAHAEKLTSAVSALDARFGTEGDAVRAREATEAFDEARRLHQEYLNERHRPELLASAIDAYTRGLAAQPDAVDMHYELARLLRVARRTDDAKPHLEYYLAHGEDPERTAQVRSWLGE